MAHLPRPLVRPHPHAFEGRDGDDLVGKAVKVFPDLMAELRR